MDIDKLIEFLLQYQGQGLKLKDIKQWCKHGDKNSIYFENNIELNINKNPYNETELSLWVEIK